jgi:hypothetical protein
MGAVPAYAAKWSRFANRSIFRVWPMTSRPRPVQRRRSRSRSCPTRQPLAQVVVSTRASVCRGDEGPRDAHKRGRDGPVRPGCSARCHRGAAGRHSPLFPWRFRLRRARSARHGADTRSGCGPDQGPDAVSPPTATRPRDPHAAPIAHPAHATRRSRSTPHRWRPSFATSSSRTPALAGPTSPAHVTAPRPR